MKHKIISQSIFHGERPSLPVTGAWDSIKLLGAASDTGETFFLPCEENFNSDTTIRLLDALQTEFGEKICVVLDNASYFTAKAVQEFRDVDRTVLPAAGFTGADPREGVLAST